MKVFGLSGGIAVGKTTAVEVFRREKNVVIFDADECVRELYEDTQFQNTLREFDPSICLEGVIQRNYLRERVFADSYYKVELEAIIHPLVRKECLALLAASRQNSLASLFIADVPLLFENGFDFGQQANLVVATTRETQRQRLVNRNKFNEAIVTAILEAQLPIAQKIERGDVVFWNEGNRRVLERQIERFIKLTI